MNPSFRFPAKSFLIAMMSATAAYGQGELRSIQQQIAQPTPPPAAQPTPQPGGTAQSPSSDRLTPSELEELLGAIALYPDPLLANVLAASVYPDEVAAAAAFVNGGGKPEQIDSKPWEDPVKAVAKIPDAIKMMGQYADWTVALGQAYLLQAKDVMDVVQTLRKKAQSTGALQTSPQQKVVVEKEVVYIKPADPEVIYVPSYSPSVVYVDDDDDEIVAGVVGFGVGVATGLILANNLDCDWHGGCVGYGWHGGGHGYHGGNYRSGNEINIDGDVNIGNRASNVSGNNVGNRANAGNRVGNEGNAWSPNRNKALANSRPTQLNQFKGGANASNRAAVPGGGRTGAGAGNRAAGAGGGLGGAQGARAGGQPGARAGAQPGARAGAQPSARSGAQPGAQPGARSGAQPGARSGAQPGARAGASPTQRPTGGAGAGAGARPASPSASPRVPTTPPRPSSPSAFGGGRDTQAASDRGAASRSRSSSSAARPSGGSARSAPARPSGGGGGGARSAPRSSGGGGRRR